MNQSQLLSFIRTILKAAGSALAAHGATKAAGIINSEDVIGVVLLIVGAIWSWKHHSDPPIATPSAPANQ